MRGTRGPYRIPSPDTSRLSVGSWGPEATGRATRCLRGERMKRRTGRTRMIVAGTWPATTEVMELREYVPGRDRVDAAEAAEPSHRLTVRIGRRHAASFASRVRTRSS